MRLWQLQIDLWPAGCVLAAAACWVALMFAIERLSRAGAIKRTQRAVQFVLDAEAEIAATRAANRMNRD